MCTPVLHLHCLHYIGTYLTLRSNNCHHLSSDIVRLVGLVSHNAHLSMLLAHMFLDMLWLTDINVFSNFPPISFSLLFNKNITLQMKLKYKNVELEEWMTFTFHPLTVYAYTVIGFAHLQASGKAACRNQAGGEYWGHSGKKVCKISLLQKIKRWTPDSVGHWPNWQSPNGYSSSDGFFFLSDLFFKLLFYFSLKHFIFKKCNVAYNLQVIKSRLKTLGKT